MRIVAKRYRDAPGVTGGRREGDTGGVGPVLGVARSLRPAVPVQAQHRRVVPRVSSRRVQHGGAELGHHLSRVQVGGVGQRRGVSFLRAVGEEHDPVPGFEKGDPGR